jgi:hypothetical protein
MLSPKGKSCGVFVSPGVVPTIIGDPRRSGHTEAAVVYCEIANGITRAVLTIVDVNSGVVTASSTSPSNRLVSNAYVDYPADPSGNKYPFLAPGADDTIVGNAPIWGFMCLYRPGSSRAGRCGKDFMEIPTTPTSKFRPSYFRESGGYLADLDGDGWQDITLIFHYGVYTISGRTGKPLGATEYDIAQGTKYAKLTSGRNYGIHTALTGPNGAVSVVMIGGAPVGQFGTPYTFCNVSRFVGVLTSKPNELGTRKLAWSHYFGFYPTTFDFSKGGFHPGSADNPPVVQLGSFEDGCIHRFADGIANMGGASVVVFNSFRQRSLVSNCLREQYSFYAPGSDGKAWLACAERNTKSRGSWTLQAFDIKTGRNIVSIPNTYVWGMSNKLLPSSEFVYLAEGSPSDHAFDLSDVPHSALKLYALVDGNWTLRGTFPKAGRPKIVLTYPLGRYAVDYSTSGSRNGYAQLVTRHVGGQDEVQLDDGSWVAFDSQAHKFVLRTP